MGELEPAARSFLAAKQLRPEAEDAKFFEIVAHLLLGEEETAFNLASQARKDFSESVRIASVWLQSAPTTMTLDQLESDVPRHFRGDPDVEIGFATAANKRGNPTKAAEYAKTAILKTPKWIEAKILWASSVIEATIKSKGCDENDELQKACSALENVIETKRAFAKPDDVAQLYINLSAGLGLLGKQSEADDLISAAYRLAPKNDAARIPYALLLTKKGEKDQAIAIFDHDTAPQSPHIQLLRAQIMAERGAAGDHEAAISILSENLKGAGGQEPAFIASWIDTLAKLHLSRRDPTSAITLLNSETAVGTLPAVTRLVLLSAAERIRGSPDKANEYAKETIKHLPNADQDEARNAAVALERTGEPALALTAWKLAVTPTSPVNDLRHVMSLVHQQGDDEYMLNLGQQCRRAGVLDQPLIEMELEVLWEISKIRYENTLSEMLEKSTEGKITRYLRMRRAQLGIESNRDDLIERDPSRLPKPEEINEHHCTLLAKTFKRADPTLAVEAAYKLLRRFPNSPNSYYAMIASIIEPDSGCPAPTIPEPASAGEDTAVQLEYLPEGDRRWYVIEHATTTIPTLNEVSADSSIGKAVQGKAKGDEIEIEEAFNNKQRARIVEVLHKWVFRFRDCMAQLPIRFPDQQVLKGFTINPALPPQEGFRELFAYMDKGQSTQSDLFLLYRNNPVISLQTLAIRLSKPIMLAMWQVVENREMRIRCCPPPPPSPVAVATNEPAPAQAIVLETTALGTMFLLEKIAGTNIYEEMGKCNSPLLVAEGTMQELEWFLREISPSAPRMGVKRRAGMLSPEIISQEELSQIASVAKPRIERLITAIRKHCEIIPGSTLPDIPSQQRNTLIEALGRPAMESVQIAISRNALLWTDDTVLSQVISQELKCHCACTQLTCRDIICKNNFDLFRRVTLGLVRLRYDITTFTFEDAIAAATQASWSVNTMPFAEILNCFALPGIPPQQLLILSVTLLKAVWSDSLLEFQAVETTQRILDRLGTRPDGRKLAEFLLSNAQPICGPQQGSPLIVHPNGTAADKMQSVIRTWLTFNQAGKIVLPDGF